MVIDYIKFAEFGYIKLRPHSLNLVLINIHNITVGYSTVILICLGSFKLPCFLVDIAQDFVVLPRGTELLDLSFQDTKKRVGKHRLDPILWKKLA